MCVDSALSENNMMQSQRGVVRFFFKSWLKDAPLDCAQSRLYLETHTLTIETFISSLTQTH